MAQPGRQTEKKDAVATIKSLYEQGKTVASIAGYLNDHGYPPPEDKPLWRASSVLYVLTKGNIIKAPAAAGDAAPKKKRPLGPIITGVAICAVLAVVGGGIALWYFNRDDDTVPDVSGGIPAGVGGSYIVDDENADQIKDILEQDNLFYVKMNVIWTFPKSNKPSEDAILSNSEYNTKSMYVTLHLEDTEEVVYQSPVVPVGKTVKDIKLSKALTKGTYKAVAVHHVLDENGQEESNVKMALDLVVEK